MSDPVVVTAVFHPAHGRHDEVLAALRPAIEAVHAEPGCILYAIHDAPDGTIVMIEKWESRALLATHGEGEAVATLNAALENIIASPTVVTALTPIPVGEKEKGAL